MTDPLADMFTRIRNANQVYHEDVTVPASRIKVEVAKILTQEGYIEGYDLEKDKPQDKIKIKLKYASDRRRVITGIRRISKPGLRVYANKDSVPKVLGGLGVAMLSTSRGILTDKQARKEGVGGEVICYIW
jgi:small subunit ribosomal protein S8